MDRRSARTIEREKWMEGIDRERVRLRVFESGNVKWNLTQLSMIICQFFFSFAWCSVHRTPCTATVRCEFSFPFTLFQLYKQIMLSVEGVKPLSETRVGKKAWWHFFVQPFPLHPLKINADSGIGGQNKSQIKWKLARTDAQRQF